MKACILGQSKYKLGPHKIEMINPDLRLSRESKDVSLLHPPFSWFSKQHVETKIRISRGLGK